MEKSNRVNKMKHWIEIHLRIYTTLYHTYQLLYCKGHIQITSNHSIIINVEKSNRVNKNETLIEIHIRIYTILNCTYPLLYCKGHIQITSNHSIINI